MVKKIVKGRRPSTFASGMYWLNLDVITDAPTDDAPEISLS